MHYNGETSVTWTNVEKTNNSQNKGTLLILLYIQYLNIYRQINEKLKDFSNARKAQLKH